MYWEPPLAAAMLVDPVAATLSLLGRRRVAAAFSLAALVLVAMSAVLLGVYEPYSFAALIPLLGLAGFLVATRLPPTGSPEQVLPGSVLVYAVGLTASRTGSGVFDFDPRLEPYLKTVLLLAGAAAGFAGAAVVQPSRGRVASAGALSALALAVLGAGFLLETRLHSVLHGDSFDLAVFAAVASTCAALVYGFERFGAVLAAASLGVALALAPSVGYIGFSGANPALLAVVALAALAVGSPLLVVDAKRLIGIEGAEKDIGHAILDRKVLAYAAPLITLAAAASLPRAETLPGAYPASAVLLSASLIGSGLGGLAVAVVLAAIGYAVRGVWAALLLASLAGPVYTIARRLPARALLPLVLLSASLAAAGYTGAAWVSSTEKTAVKPVGLGSPGPVARPSEEVVHDYFLVYLGVKNQTMLYSLLEPRIGREQALEMAKFTAVIAALAEKRGIRDPYNITDLRLPEEMPALVVEVEGLKVNIAPRDVIAGHRVEVEHPLRCGLSLVTVKIPGDAVGRLRRSYLVLVADPANTGGDALRYALYTAMSVSWAEKGSLNETAPLLLSVLAGNTSVASVDAVVHISTLPGGVIALLLYAVLLSSAPVSAFFTREPQEKI